MRIIVLVLLAAVLSGCGARAPEPTLFTVPEPEPTATEPSVPETVPDDPDYYIRYVYPEQLRELYTGLTRGWKAEDYTALGRSPLTAAFAGGDPLGSVGFLLEDLDGDGIRELVIGAIRGAREEPLIFEVWTLDREEPQLVLRAEEGERYFLLEGTPGLFARETGGDPPLRRRLFREGGFRAAEVEAAPVSYRIPRYYPFSLYGP